MVKNEVLLWCTFFVVYTLVKVNSKVTEKLRNLECFPNKDWVNNMTCKLRAVSRKKVVININAELKQDLNRIMIHAQGFKRYNTYQPFPINVSFEYCQLIRGNNNYNIFAPFVRGVMNKYTNVNHTCPYYKGDKIIVKDLDWQPSEYMNINLPAGTGRYRLDINIYGNEAKTRTALVILHADFTEEY